MRHHPSSITAPPQAGETVPEAGRQYETVCLALQRHRDRVGSHGFVGRLAHAFIDAMHELGPEHARRNNSPATGVRSWWRHDMRARNTVAFVAARSLPSNSWWHWVASAVKAVSRRRRGRRPAFTGLATRPPRSTAGISSAGCLKTAPRKAFRPCGRNAERFACHTTVRTDEAVSPALGASCVTLLKRAAPKTRQWRRSYQRKPSGH
jgi:hypothetical protein